MGHSGLAEFTTFTSAQMWAVIDIYTGREDNIFWRRVPGAPQFGG